MCIYRPEGEDTFRRYTYIYTTIHTYICTVYYYTYNKHIHVFMQGIRRKEGEEGWGGGGVRKVENKG